MTNLSQKDKLIQIICAAGGQVKGAKKLQKLVYLAGKSGFKTGHPFRYHYHGVYAGTIEENIQEATAEGLLSVEADKSPDSRRDFVLSRPDAVEVDFNNPGLALVASLKDEEARTLEVLSTIVYLSSLGLSDEGLGKKLGELKGHIPESFHKDAWRLYRELGFDKQG